MSRSLVAVLDRPESNRRERFETIGLRLNPGEDIRRYLEDFSKEQKISAGAILSAVGSLSKTRLRFADNDTHTELSGKQEVLTLSGMLSDEGVHLHMSVADSNGECKGGHVVYGCIVYTTLEIAIALLPNTTFQRVFDSKTGFKELKVIS
ncbi:PPC domain-containing DNA-binding protein [cf. Phormidesmis sp. LEGE 11477]|uniref:PPC domain-containing DNA-binding protein n=1 Tax=cf. Phormidesmis sp. LEGE 11477 TaxID=1828680 RepID=UPI0018822E7B|nr:PPC domain-containing DNA-binding protein [cf. Phormidesmis sp. LEGE 11477]MBE9062162.1 DNA-binding protein [cf. Phormidesmis sp. LEGE 11477]